MYFHTFSVQNGRWGIGKPCYKGYWKGNFGYLCQSFLHNSIYERLALRWKYSRCHIYSCRTSDHIAYNNLSDKKELSIVLLYVRHPKTLTMKVVAISYFMPYWENLRGISALIYSLIKYRPKNVNLSLYSFNCNHLSSDQISQVRKELNVPVTIIPEPKEHAEYKPGLFSKYLRWIFPDERNMLRIPNSFVEKIRGEEPDYIWLYPLYFYHVPEQMPEMKYVLTSCDSNALLKKRSLKDAYYRNNWLKYIKAWHLYKLYLSIENKYPTHNCLIHFVGKEDSNFYNSHVKHGNGRYIAHPHYFSVAKNIVDFNAPKLRVLWSGKNDFYMFSEGRKMFTMLRNNAKTLSPKIKLTFLGMGWENYCDKLRQDGYDTEVKTWVDNYAEEVANYDIQLVPLSLGTGTKGKVLDAMTSGLLVIGSRYALENITYDSDKCICYRNAQDVAYVFEDIFNDREKYMSIAENGKKYVLTYHNPKVCSASFFKMFKQL